MNIAQKSRLKDIITKVITYLLIIYTFVMLGRSIYLNYELKKQAEDIKSEIASVENKNKNLENLILYYKSDSFREVEARKKLDLKKPGEKVVILPVKEKRDFIDEMKTQGSNLVENVKSEKQSNYSLWWRYFVK